MIFLGKHIFVFLSVFGLLLSFPARGFEPDSLKLARLDSALLGYTFSIETADPSFKNGECDFLIGSVSDSLTSKHIALWLFDHYRNSRLMGDEAVAIHIFDTYFASGRIGMRSEFDRLDAEIFADFNRSTLIGMKAPRIGLKDKRGRLVEIPTDSGVSVLFFYDTSCSKCRIESQLLPEVLKTVSFPLTFYAVYCSDKRKEWDAFKRSFKVRNPRVGVVHLWDPDMETQYLKLYGVISTPRIYVTSEDGTVIGRRLEVDSLQELLNILSESYGKKEI